MTSADSSVPIDSTEVKAHWNFKDITGQKFGRLLVIELEPTKKWGRYCWKCKCDCGNDFTACGNSLRSGNTKSCGCLTFSRVQLGEGFVKREFTDSDIIANGVNNKTEGSNRPVQPIAKPTLIAPTVEEALRKLHEDLKRMPMTVNPPSRGKSCPWTGLPKTTFFNLISPSKANGHKPPVYARYQKTHRHAKRGRWIIRSEDLLRYWYGIPDEGPVITDNRTMAAEIAERS